MIDLQYLHSFQLDSHNIQFHFTFKSYNDKREINKTEISNICLLFFFTSFNTIIAQ